MKGFLFAMAVGVMSQAALGADIDPSNTILPWKNGPTRDARYSLAETANVGKVHVFEAFSIGCGWCQRNAPQVKAMAAEFANDARVQFIDLGLDTADRAYRSWISTHKPNYPVVQDVGEQVFARLRTQNVIPQTFVVACDGTLVGSTVGFWGEQSKAELKEAIAQAKQVVCEN